MYCHHTLICHKCHVKHTSNQCRPLEEWIAKGHQRDANLCGACTRPTDERSLVREEEGYNQGSFVYFAKACWGWETHAMRTLHEEANT